MAMWFLVPIASERGRRSVNFQASCARWSYQCYNNIYNVPTALKNNIRFIDIEGMEVLFERIKWYLWARLTKPSPFWWTSSPFEWSLADVNHDSLPWIIEAPISYQFKCIRIGMESIDGRWKNFSTWSNCDLMQKQGTQPPLHSIISMRNKLARKPSLIAAINVTDYFSIHAQINVNRDSLFIGMMICGITGSIFEPPCSSKSRQPMQAKHDNGNSSSESPSKKIGKKWW